MLAKLNTFALVGIEAVPVHVEVDASAGLFRGYPRRKCLVALPEIPGNRWNYTKLAQGN
jgi:hypothetical protein